MDKALLPVLILSVYIAITYSCKCLPGDFDLTLCEYDLVFLGTPISEKAPSPPDTLGDRVYTFRVEEIFWGKHKFARKKLLNVSTPPKSAMCGSYFELNTRYVISAHKSSGRWSTILCDQNQDWSNVPKVDKDFLSDSLRGNCSQQAL